MLKVSHVTKYYDDFRAVNDLSFEIKEGEIFGLLGVNGAGKTTTFRMIMGLLDKTKGEITLDGKKIDYTLTDQIGFLTEERSLITSKTVLEQAIYYGVLKGMTEKEVEKKLDEYLDEFNIKEYKNKKIKELSKGNQQKIQFIISILHSPRLLILDEPFSGLDPINVEMFKKVILRLKKNKTMIIFSSHRMEHVELFCKKIVIILHGKAVLEGNIKDIKEKYRKKNIFIKGDVSVDDLKDVKGIVDIIKHAGELEVKIEDINCVDNVFKKIKNKRILKFVVEEPSLNEIFVDKVGESYEK